MTDSDSDSNEFAEWLTKQGYSAKNAAKMVMLDVFSTTNLVNELAAERVTALRDQFLRGTGKLPELKNGLKVGDRVVHLLSKGEVRGVVVSIRTTALVRVDSSLGEPCIDCLYNIENIALESEYDKAKTPPVDNMISPPSNVVAFRSSGMGESAYCEDGFCKHCSAPQPNHSANCTLKDRE